ncbi:hypothetical protein F5879DRAFT_987708 [Lentinula edodes]|nr:hypothetical protein F5879DRAFT_987708 [Lentinula edodes]
MPSGPPSSAINIQPLLLSSSLSQNVPYVGFSIRKDRRFICHYSSIHLSPFIALPRIFYISNYQSGSRMPTSISIYPVALFSILDHYLRRKDDQDRVIGTLFGTRTETHVAIRTSFAVLPSETSKQVVEVIVGWYPTGSHLKTYPALIQNFYSQETAPYQAVHIPLDYGVEPGQLAGVKGYIRCPTTFSAIPSLLPSFRILF